MDEKKLIEKDKKSTENRWIIGFAVLFLLLESKNVMNLSFAKFH